VKGAIRWTPRSAECNVIESSTYRLFQLNLVDFDALVWVGKLFIDCKFVIFTDLFCLQIVLRQVRRSAAANPCLDLTPIQDHYLALGFLAMTRTLPIAMDCSVRFSSSSAGGSGQKTGERVRSSTPSRAEERTAADGGAWRPKAYHKRHTPHHTIDTHTHTYEWLSFAKFG
jgi:hypothetical protein